MRSAKEPHFSFNSISLQSCEAPDWYAAIMRDADEHGGDVPDIYRRNGVYLDHQFGQDLHSVYDYDAGAHGRLIEYWDVSSCLAVIFIDDVAAYLQFRAKYLHAWAWLIKDMERRADIDFEKVIRQQRKRA